MEKRARVVDLMPSNKQSVQIKNDKDNHIERSLSLLRRLISLFHAGQFEIVIHTTTTEEKMRKFLSMRKDKAIETGINVSSLKLAIHRELIFSVSIRKPCEIIAFPSGFQIACHNNESEKISDAFPLDNSRIRMLHFLQRHAVSSILQIHELNWARLFVNYKYWCERCSEVEKPSDAHWLCCRCFIYCRNLFTRNGSCFLSINHSYSFNGCPWYHIIGIWDACARAQSTYGYFFRVWLCNVFTV